MKKTRLNPIGKIGRRNIQANQTLKWIYTDYGITKCEVNLPGCTKDNFLSFAHKEKRDWYKAKDRMHLLADFNSTVLACINCHNKLEENRKLTLETFQKLRPKKCLYHQPS